MIIRSSTSGCPDNRTVSFSRSIVISTDRFRKRLHDYLFQMDSQVPIARPQKSDSAVMGVRPSVLRVREHRVQAPPRRCLEIGSKAGRTARPQPAASCLWGVPGAEAQTTRSSRQHHGNDRAEEEQSRRMCRLRILYYGVCHSDGPFKVELPP